jgi:integrase
MGIQTSYNQGVMSDLQGFFKPGQRELIYSHCTLPRDKLLVRLLWKTGRRIGEILMLKVSEVDFLNANILWHIEKKKHDYPKWKPVDKETLKQLKEYVDLEDLQPDDFLFYNPYTYRPITRQRAFQIVQLAASKSNIFFVGTKKPHPHHFRHSFAIDKAKKLKSPADMRKLQQYMEHSSMGMTEHYLQFGDQDQRSLVEDD